MKRLFIAINLPEEIKQRIKRLVSNIKIDADVRWLPPENWHLTISFLGEQPEEGISAISDALKETAAAFSAPTIEFEKITLAPAHRPRMIWLVGIKETSKILGEIKIKLEDELVKNGVRFKRENREYNVHLTIARFRSPLINADIERINADIISINQLINQRKSAFGFQAKSLDLMESYLKRTGAEYEILTKLDFKQIN